MYSFNELMFCNNYVIEITCFTLCIPITKTLHQGHHGLRSTYNTNQTLSFLSPIIIFLFQPPSIVVTACHTSPTNDATAKSRPTSRLHSVHICCLASSAEYNIARPYRAITYNSWFIAPFVIEAIPPWGREQRVLLYESEVGPNCIYLTTRYSIRQCSSTNYACSFSLQ